MKTKNIFLVMLLAITLTTIVSFACNNDDDTSPKKNEVSIEGMAYNPSVITVNVNTTVTWTNNDGVAHTVTSNDGLFDSGNLADNATYSFTFTTAGTYTYHCSLHPDMTGSVVVQAATSSSGY